MNNTTEPSRPQLEWGDTASEDSAEAAQRDLFEFLASETPASGILAPGMLPSEMLALETLACEAMAPPLVADTMPQAELAPPSVPGHLEASDERFDAIPDEDTHPVPVAVLCDADADGEACEHAARSAAQAVDEVTQENLRRLEATMDWLQNEVRSCQLPRAPQIAPVRGVPSVQAQPGSSSAFDAVIDRSTLHRTVQGSSVNGPSVHGSSGNGVAPLPIWLREHEAPIRLPPPRRSGGLWQRLVKFFWGCAVAAPIAYVFAITTSPLHKHLADMTGLAHALSLSLPAPPGQHEPLRGRDLIAIAPIAVPENSEASSVASKLAAVAGEGAPAVGGMPGDPDRIGAPDAVHGPMARPVIVTFDAGETQPQTAPADDDSGTAKKAAARSSFLLPPPLAGEGRGGGRGGEAIANVIPSPDSASGNVQDVGALTAQGKEFFAAGDLVAARILFTRAAKAGDAAAAIAMGATYDPVVLTERGVRGVAADLDKARAWYERAKDMGSSEGPRRLEVLANR